MTFSSRFLLPVAAGFFYACTILTTRRLCREESPITLAYGVAAVFLAMGAVGLYVFTDRPLAEYATAWPYVFTGWRPVEIWVYGVIAVCSVSRSKQ